MPRIISTIASATEIVCALGCEQYLVARSHECDFPKTVLKLPVCSTPKIDIHADSRKIDISVKALAKDGVSIYEIDSQVLHELRPDIIITQSQCEVCAVSGTDVLVALKDYPGHRPEVITISPRSLHDVWCSINEIATAIGVEESGKKLVESFTNRLSTINAGENGEFSVCCLEWFEPLMAAGNWIPELVAMAGGKEVIGIPGQHSGWLTWEELLENDPMFLILMPCGFTLERGLQELHWLTENPVWQSLSAVKNDRVFLVDSNSYFTRPGPRLIESAEILAEILHPTRFSFEGLRYAWSKV